MSRSMSPVPDHFPQRGFALIEVLVALVILTIGLLGLANLHAVAIAQGNSSLLRNKATMLAYEMADRIRANRPGAAAGAYNGFSATGAVSASPGCVTTGCTTVQLAQNDFWEWNQELSAALPQGGGVVCIDQTLDDGNLAAPACDGAGGVLAVKVFWSEKSKSYVFAAPVRP
jgi:type IV pilus assembly protein PilV